MPSLGADMDRGTLVEWLVAPGDEVHRGQVVAVIDTEKSDIEAEVWEDGTIGALLVEPGTEAPVGTPLATIVPAGAAVPATTSSEAPTSSETPTTPAPGPPASAPTTEPSTPPPPPGPAPRPTTEPVVLSPVVRHLAQDLHVDVRHVNPTGPGHTVTRHDVEVAAASPRHSPRARRLAAELGVDLAGLSGTGSGGAVTGADVELAAGQASASPPEPTRPARPADGDRTERAQQATAALMERSKREIPHYYLSSTIELGAAMDWLHGHNERLPLRSHVVPAALLLKAAATALTEVPSLNGHWVDGTFRPSPRVDLGVAVARRDGTLLTPTIADAAGLGVDEVMESLHGLVTRVRSGRLRGADLRPATATVTNLGDQGAESVQGVIYPPQVALVGFGRIVERPWAVHGGLTVRPVVTATLAADHRATAGHTGSVLLAAVDRLLQHPEEL